jgi:ankyrin repeat protein
MIPRIPRIPLIFVGVASFCLAEVDFEKDVKPIFREKCYSCHGPAQQMGGLRMDQKATVLSGGRGRPDLVPGAIERSSVYLRVAGTTQGPRMPLTGPLSDEEIATIKKWIEEGAPWPDEPSLPSDWQPDSRVTPLFEQIRKGNFKAVRDAVTANPELLRARDPKGDTLLLRTALYGKAEDVQWLLSKGADPNVANVAGGTPLMWAVEDVAKVRALLNVGADPNAHTQNGRTALMIATDQKRVAPVLKALIEKGAKSDPEAGQVDPLVAVSANGDLESMKLLAGTRGGRYPPATLVAAAQSNCLDCVRMILDQSPPGNAISDALRAAARLGRLDVLELLFAAGADVNARDAAGNTALLRAAYSDFLEPARIKLLLDHGADVNVRDATGDTPLMKARHRGATRIVEMLLAAGARE